MPATAAAIAAAYREASASLLEEVPATLEPASTVIRIPEDAASDYEVFNTDDL